MSPQKWINRYLHEDMPDEKAFAFLQAIINSSYDGIWVCDGQGRVLAINRATEKHIGITADEVLGQAIEDLVEQGLVDRAVTPDVLEKRKVVSNVQLVRSTRKRLLVTGTPVFDDDGEIILVVANERDITLYDEILEELHQSREKEKKLQEELVKIDKILNFEDRYICESKEMRDAVRTALTLAGYNESNILLLGESGTGKGMLARIIHQHSARADHAFVHINCAALPENLLEAELFGYERGAFTGAKSQGKAGLFEVADSGCVFLDEIGELPLRIQSKILTYLDDHEITRLGGTEVRRIDCSIIAATNRNIEAMVADKRFRNDLYYRLNSFSIEVPPLRRRPEDIFELATYFVDKYNTKYGVQRRIGNAVMGLLLTYAFPGNIRELKNMIKRAVALSPGENIDAMIAEAVGETGQRDYQPQVEDLPEESLNLTNMLNSFEKVILTKTMKNCRTTRELADYLGVSQATVVRKMKRAGLSYREAKTG